MVFDCQYSAWTFTQKGTTKATKWGSYRDLGPRPFLDPSFPGPSVAHAPWPVSGRGSSSRPGRTSSGGAWGLQGKESGSDAELGCGVPMEVLKWAERKVLKLRQ